MSLPLVLALSLAGAGPAPAAAPDRAALEARQRAFEARRIAALTAEDGWLSVVGLAWLPEGEAPVGSAADAAVRLPPSAPARVGVLRRSGATVTFTPAPGSAIAVNGKPFAGGTLQDDSSGATPDV